MSWRDWWSEQLHRIPIEVEGEKKPDAQADSAHDLNRSTNPRTRTMHWLQRAYGNQHVQRMVDSLRGRGRALEPSSRSRLEAAYDQDLGEVRVHTEPEAQAAALELGARAFTDGPDVFLAPNAYDPNSSAGGELLTHEVAHVIQQSGGSEAGNQDMAQNGAEAEAERAADRVASGEHIDFALSPVHDAQPALQGSNWGDDVRAAQGIADDAARAQAMLALIQRAVGTTITVNQARNTHPTQAHPDDYQTVPAINFDIHLNDKNSYASSGPGYALRRNYGYSFRHSSTNYSVLGPQALDPRSPVLTRMYAEHELYLARQWLSRRGPVDPNRNNQELDLLIHDFVGFFHQIIGLGQQWLPMIQYYQAADPQPRQAALTQLVDYYTNPPVAPAEAARVRQAFADWLRHRLRDQASTQLVQDLESQLHLGTSAPAHP